MQLIKISCSQKHFFSVKHFDISSIYWRIKKFYALLFDRCIDTINNEIMAIRVSAEDGAWCANKQSQYSIKFAIISYKIYTFRVWAFLSKNYKQQYNLKLIDKIDETMNKTMKSIKDKMYIAIRRYYTKDFRKITISHQIRCCKLLPQRETWD